MTEVTDETIRIWDILAGKLKTWLADSVAILPNLVVAVLLMIAFNFLSQIVSGLIGRLLNRNSENPTVVRLLQNFMRMLILLFGLFTALGILNLEKTVASLLAGAGVIGLAIGFAFQEIAANFFSGILIALKKPFKPGDIVQIDTFVGTVRDLTLRTTNIMTYSGLEILIPNKDMFTKPVTNFTSTPERRIEISGGVPYNGDLRKIAEIAKKAVENIEGRLPSRATEFYYVGFGDSAINFKLGFWIEYPGQNYFQLGTHNAIIAIKEAFDENGISMPFPTQTLDVDVQKIQGLFSPNTTPKPN